MAKEPTGRLRPPKRDFVAREGGYHAAVVGVRAVGREMMRVLHQRDFPIASLRVFATRERDITVDGDAYHVEVINEEAFDEIDVAFFAGGDVREGHFGPLAARRGAVVIDNGDAFRLDAEVPLVVPEVNPEALRGASPGGPGSHSSGPAAGRLIANPNCSTIQFVLVLKPLHDAARLKRAVVATYQSVSGRGTSRDGSDPVEQLRVEMAAISGKLARLVKGSGGGPGGSKLLPNGPEARLHGVVEAVSEGAAARVTDPGLFPHPIAGNVIPQISSFDETGYSKEEMKLVYETRKILGEPGLKITATTARVPVFNAHAEAANLEFERPIRAAQAREILSRTPGVIVVDDPAQAAYPMPIYASGKDEVFVGRIREDATVPHGLNLWIVADNLRKGAALNAVQIAEKMMEMGLLSPRR